MITEIIPQGSLLYCCSEGAQNLILILVIATSIGSIVRIFILTTVPVLIVKAPKVV